MRLPSVKVVEFGKKIEKPGFNPNIFLSKSFLCGGLKFDASVRPPMSRSNLSDFAKKEQNLEEFGEI